MNTRQSFFSKRIMIPINIKIKQFVIQQKIKNDKEVRWFGHLNPYHTLSYYDMVKPNKKWRQFSSTRPMAYYESAKIPTTRRNQKMSFMVAHDDNLKTNHMIFSSCLVHCLNALIIFVQFLELKLQRYRDTFLCHLIQACQLLEKTNALTIHHWQIWVPFI